MSSTLDLSLDTIITTLKAHTPHTRASETSERNAAVAMIIRNTSANGLETLFMQRAEHPGDPWSGQMSFPGGRVEPEDATIETAARRETIEEVGIRLAPRMRIGRLHDVEGGRLQTHRLAVSPFVYYHPDPPEPTHNEEVADTVWVPLSFITDPKNISIYRFPGDPSQREFPSFHYESFIIWGLTYRILTSFANLFDVDLPGEAEMTDVE